MKCPECGSREIGGHPDPAVNAIGWMQCEECQLSDDADGFADDDEDDRD